MNSSNGPDREHVLGRARDLVNQGKFDEALKVITTSGIKDAAVANAAGVCHLRAGRPDRAVAVLRDLCVGDGTDVKHDASPLHVVNYATALLLTGNLSGYRHVLRSVAESQHPAAVRLSTATTVWERSLGRWRRLGMMLGVWTPKLPIDLGFPPGEL
jgi:hypothetical protein